jgi:hypothetical protein
MRTPGLVILVTTAVFTVAACGGALTTDETLGAESRPIDEGVVDTLTGGDSAAVSFSERIDAVDDAVTAWRSAASIEAAHAAAETAANLIVGSGGPGYGDRDGDGTIGGDASVGLLPGLDSASVGLATPLGANDCIVRDVLGGAWSDHGAEWGAMLAAIDAWRPDKNTMPTLASHPMRIVGWATFTVGSDSLDDAHEFAGHAKLHVNITRRALDC